MHDDTFLDVNVEFLKFFDFQRDIIIGHSAAEFGLGLGLGLGLDGASEQESEARERFLNYVKKEGRVGNYEMEIKHPSGDIRNVLASVQHIFLDDQDALITTFIDITDRVAAEQQIRALASELTATEQAERHRLAQVLHDDLQQRIFAVQMQLSFLKEAYERNDLQAFAADFPQLEEWLADTIKVTRQLSVDLSPPILHGEGLVEAAVWLASQMQEQYGLNVHIHSDGQRAELKQDLRVLLFYALRELLFNIVKHAETLEANITFAHHEDDLTLIVSDGGIGFDSQKVLQDPSLSHGLLNIRHRLNLLGCLMEIRSEPGKGSEVIITAPYEQPVD
jgi:PAS domain S-box-containing protein